MGNPRLAVNRAMPRNVRMLEDRELAKPSGRTIGERAGPQMDIPRIDTRTSSALLNGGERHANRLFSGGRSATILAFAGNGGKARPAPERRSASPAGSGTAGAAGAAGGGKKGGGDDDDPNIPDVSLFDLRSMPRWVLSSVTRLPVSIFVIPWMLIRYAEARHYMKIGRFKTAVELYKSVTNYLSILGRKDLAAQTAMMLGFTLRYPPDAIPLLRERIPYNEAMRSSYDSFALAYRLYKKEGDRKNANIARELMAETSFLGMDKETLGAQAKKLILPDVAKDKVMLVLEKAVEYMRNHRTGRGAGAFETKMGLAERFGEPPDFGQIPLVTIRAILFLFGARDAADSIKIGRDLKKTEHSLLISLRTQINTIIVSNWLAEYAEFIGIEGVEKSTVTDAEKIVRRKLQDPQFIGDYVIVDQATGAKSVTVAGIREALFQHYRLAPTDVKIIEWFRDNKKLLKGIDRFTGAELDRARSALTKRFKEPGWYAANTFLDKKGQRTITEIGIRSVLSEHYGIKDSFKALAPPPEDMEDIEGRMLRRLMQLRSVKPRMKEISTNTKIQNIIDSAKAYVQSAGFPKEYFKNGALTNRGLNEAIRQVAGFDTNDLMGEAVDGRTSFESEITIDVSDTKAPAKALEFWANEETIIIFGWKELDDIGKRALLLRFGQMINQYNRDFPSRPVMWQNESISGWSADHYWLRKLVGSLNDLLAIEKTLKETHPELSSVEDADIITISTAVADVLKRDTQSDIRDDTGSLKPERVENAYKMIVDGKTRATDAVSTSGVTPLPEDSEGEDAPITEDDEGPTGEFVIPESSFFDDAEFTTKNK